MAEKKVSNERKKELQQMDPFQANLLKAMAYAKEYKKLLILISSAIVVVAIVFSATLYSFQKAEHNAAVIVSKALTKYAEANDPDKGYLAIKNDFQTVFEDYSNTSAGKQALVQFAKICYDASKFDLSYQYYKKALKIFKNQALMENFILASLGNVCLAKKDLKEAEKYFFQIENGTTDLLKDQARFILAALYETSGNNDESKKMYENIVAEYENSMYKPIAKSKIDAIKK